MNKHSFSVARVIESLGEVAKAQGSATSLCLVAQQAEKARGEA